MDGKSSLIFHTLDFYFLPMYFACKLCPFAVSWMKNEPKVVCTLSQAPFFLTTL